MTVVPLLLFGMLELSLSLGGYGDSRSFFRDGNSIGRADEWLDNPEFGRWVFPRDLDRTPPPIPFALAKKKAKHTYRIFVLGESAAMGFPDPSTSFARVLEVLLRARYPGTDFEVVNAAMVAINSHVVLPIARQCADQEPDLFVVHLGNNEVVGPFGAAGVLGPFSPKLSMIRANLALKATKTGQLLQRTIQGVAGGKRPSRVWEGMAMFAGSHVEAGDPRLTRIVSNFEKNLEDICEVGAHRGIPVVVCTIPVNLVDCAPFGSSHSPTLANSDLEAWQAFYDEGIRFQGEGKYPEAIRFFEKAAGLDDQFAELAYRHGRCLAQRGMQQEAKAHFSRARDLDTLRFRTDSTINATIRNVVMRRAGTGTFLADAEQEFADRSLRGSPGEEFFLEHVHMNFAGNYLLARTVYQTLTDSKLGLPESAGPSAPLTEQACAEQLGQTEWSESKIVGQIYTMLTQLPPFTFQYDHLERGKRWEAKLASLHKRLQSGGLQRSVGQNYKAVQANETDWMLRLNFGLLLTECGDIEQAKREYVGALASLRHCFPARCKLGTLLLRTGDVEGAIDHFREAIRLAPENPEAHFGMAEALAAQGRNDEALAIYEERVRKDPSRGFALIAQAGFELRRGKLEEAEGLLNEALRLEPHNVSIMVMLGDVAVQQQHKATAVTRYEAALEIRPDMPSVRAVVDRLRKELSKPAANNVER